MARNQKNFDNFLYVDDNNVSWTKRGEDGGGAQAIDGHAAGTGAPTWIDSARMSVRKILYVEPNTFRTAIPIFYTQAAFNAVALGSTMNVGVEGDALGVNYTAVKKIAEKQPRRGPARQLADS